MKIALIILGIFAILFIVFQTYTSMATEKTETQAYKVIKVEKEFEIRFYPAATIATITSSAKTYKELGTSGFSTLAGYIFGGNKDKKQIAMTSPVYMEITDSASQMSFVMPSNYNKQNLPQPNNSQIKIKTTPDQYVAAIRFSGFASTADINNQANILQNALKAHHIAPYGHFRYLGYNPPFQLFGRRNEVIVALDPTAFSHQ